MAVIESPSGVLLEVESDKKAERAINVPRGRGYSVAEVTGTVAAALAANSCVFAMRLDPGATDRAFIDRVRLQWTTLVAFTTAVSAGRRLALYRGSGAATAGGTSIPEASKKWAAGAAASEFDLAQGGDIRIATTGSLTQTGITWEARPIAVATLSHAGAAGAFYETILEFAPSESYEVVLEPGQLLGVRTPVVMDAVGTWQLGVNVQWREAPAY